MSLPLGLSVWSAPRIQHTQALISSAQIIASHDTPILIVPAQGENTLISIVSSFYKLLNATVQYANTDGAGLKYADDFGANFDINGAAGLLLGGSANDCAIGQFASVTSGPSTNVINQPIVFTSDVGPTTGDGDLLIDVLWTVRSISFVAP